MRASALVKSLNHGSRLPQKQNTQDELYGTVYMGSFKKNYGTGLEVI